LLVRHGYQPLLWELERPWIAARGAGSPPRGAN